jgi:hypothetical protein
VQVRTALVGFVVANALAGCHQILGLEQPVHEPADGGVDVDANVMHDGYCDPGYTLTGDGCIDIDECATNTDTCSTNASCTNVAGSFTCACNAGYDGDGMACTKRCNTVLVYTDCPAPSTSCASINESTFLSNAVTGRGLTIKLTTDPTVFANQYDAGGFELVIVDSGRTDITDGAASRAAAWVTADKPAIVSFWNLDNSTTGQTLRTALGVDVTTSFTTPKDAYYDPNGGVNLFNRVEQLTSPMTFSNPFSDDGDVLALTGAGKIVARFNSATGGGAATLTHNDKAITFGFLPVEATKDDDADGKSDAQELYSNAIAYLCGY